MVTDIYEEPIHASYLILTSSSLLPSSTAIVFKELFTSQSLGLTSGLAQDDAATLIEPYPARR